MTTDQQTAAGTPGSPAEASADREALRAAGAELVSVASRLSRLGLSPGSSGNASVRVGERIVATPTGSEMGGLDPAALSQLDLEGALVAGPRTTKEFPLHRALYRRDPSARAVVHLHSASAAAVSCLAPWSELSAIAPISPYFVMRVGQTPLIPYADPGDPAQADDVEALPIPFRAVLLQNHGSLVVGPDLASAAEIAIELEEACRLWLLVRDRDAHHLSHDDAARLADRYGSIWSR
ncbi:class II aldolase/adducin family protein [Compostimonas suwonensis]|uniref:Ribulose-5-phosphate 4-epimerase/fuculose-1-phosphate aldolase n=1 Tax=Compostimonas suwonensis TaxID=1048394 RepID=A0A2M9BZF4_9MICO|nr:class II aldolase/adducin family protein [Compostimonas suwonensis]PJJ63461.1 ribulose-5-phosphate 4-epimerase/fuculose-1-phosphate aldolase [Compostimonas suwonensis]